MSDQEILAEVKASLGRTDTGADTLLTRKIKSVKAYLTNAGVSADVLTSDDAVEAITRGVLDTWNITSGEAKFSGMFYDMAAQLVAKSRE